MADLLRAAAAAPPQAPQAAALSAERDRLQARLSDAQAESARLTQRVRELVRCLHAGTWLCQCASRAHLALYACLIA